MLNFCKCLFVFIYCVSIFSCKQTEKVYTKVELSFDTVCSVQIFTEKDEKTASKILEEVFEKLKELEYIFSPTLKESELFKVNNIAPKIDITVSKEFRYLLEENLKIARLTSGEFNPCVGKLSSIWRELWTSQGKNPELPTKEAIENALKHTDYKSIILSEKTIRKTKPVYLDFGASAKGYATDCIKEILIKNEIKRAVIDLGGNVAVLGKKEKGMLWKIGIKMPILHSNNRVAGYVETFDRAVVSSGNYERFFEKDGKIYHHILSSKTGFPIENELRAVTIISSKATLADILSTSCFVLGAKKGSALLKHFPGVSGIFFFKNGDVLQVNKRGCLFNIIDRELKYIEK